MVAALTDSIIDHKIWR